MKMSGMKTKSYFVLIEYFVNKILFRNLLTRFLIFFLFFLDSLTDLENGQKEQSEGEEK